MSKYFVISNKKLSILVIIFIISLYNTYNNLLSVPLENIDLTTSSNDTTATIPNSNTNLAQLPAESQNASKKESENIIKFLGSFDPTEHQKNENKFYILVDKPSFTKFSFEVIPTKFHQNIKVTKIIASALQQIIANNENGIDEIMLFDPGIYEIVVTCTSEIKEQISYNLYVKTIYELKVNPQNKTNDYSLSMTNATFSQIQSLSNTQFYNTNTQLNLQTMSSNQIQSNELSATTSKTNLNLDQNQSTNLKNKLDESIIIVHGSGEKFNNNNVDQANKTLNFSKFYLDSYKPIRLADIHFNKSLQDFENYIKLYYVNEKGERVYSSYKYQLDEQNNELLIYIQNIINGAIYYLQIFEPNNKRLILEEKIKTLPIFNSNCSFTESKFKVTISWSKIGNVMESSDFQVINLQDFEVELLKNSVLYYKKEIIDDTFIIQDQKVSIYKKPYSVEINVDLVDFSENDLLEFNLYISSLNEQNRRKILSIKQNIYKLLNGNSKISKPSQLDLVTDKTIEHDYSYNDVSNINKEKNEITNNTIASLPEITKVEIEELDIPKDTNSTLLTSQTQNLQGNYDVINTNSADINQKKIQLQGISKLENLPANVELKFTRKLVLPLDKNIIKTLWISCIIWNSDGNMLLLDSQNACIYVLNEEGNILHSFGKKGKQPGQMLLPTFFESYNNRIYVSDAASHRVHVFSLDGRYLFRFGNWGLKESDLDLPYGIVIKDDYVYIADRGNNKIVKFDLQGNFISKVASINRPVFLSFLKSLNAFLVLDEEGNLYNFTDTVIQSKINLSKNEIKYMYIDIWENIWIIENNLKIKRLDKNATVIKQYCLQEVSSNTNVSIKSPVALGIREDGKMAIFDSYEKNILLFALQE